MRRKVLFLCSFNELVLTISVIVYCGNICFACPKGCFCPSMSQNVYCTRQSLLAIPDGIPYDTLELTLNDNRFKNPVLTRRNFTNLPNLTNLYLSGCGIESIAIDTFAGLTKLKWLDISKNELKFIADFTFRGLNLENFFINENPGIQFSPKAFDGLTTRGLYMHGCSLMNLSLDVLRPLNGSLRALWLYDNQFERLEKDWFYLLKSLSHVRLGKNNFHCNCEMSWLYEFFITQDSIFSGGDAPSCSSPPQNNKKLFNELKTSDFTCELPTFKNVDAVFESELGKLTCTATGDPSPTLFWVRPDGTTETYYPLKQETDKDNEGVMYITNPQSMEKAKYKCIANNPAGNVTFSLNLAWPVVKDSHVESTLAPLTATTTTVNKQYSVGGKKNSYEWTVNKPEKNMGIVSTNDKVKHFSIVDIVGAVIGTFLLTLLICALVFHLYYRRRERLSYEEKDCCEKNKHPKNVYTMSDHDENCIKMMIHHHNSDHIHS
ncbi:leucine-rich repeat and fibronectin type III domain-containing protein 1-like protein [Patella vulgata]|uniref:leucine-rich repeat and fibronectin type III domain-containing protein 1-like protein n=1 Tax=Patella vulgata TaxID=6465 RepID=UPI00217F71A2|nr:leucine-rich repeat and fibronectin type III domain-containing protein 1-like protein [Patella vulgata]